MASSDYKKASPDPLRDVAEDIVNQINANNMEDIFRFCNVYVDLDFVVSKQSSLLPISGAELLVSLQISWIVKSFRTILALPNVRCQRQR